MCSKIGDASTARVTELATLYPFSPPLLSNGQWVCAAMPPQRTPLSPDLTSVKWGHGHIFEIQPTFDKTASFPCRDQDVDSSHSHASAMSSACPKSCVATHAVSPCIERTGSQKQEKHAKTHKDTCRHKAHTRLHEQQNSHTHTPHTHTHKRTHTTPQHTTTHHTHTHHTPHHTPHRTAPRHTTQHHPTPHRTTPHRANTPTHQHTNTPTNQHTTTPTHSLTPSSFQPCVPEHLLASVQHRQHGPLACFINLN